MLNRLALPAFLVAMVAVFAGGVVAMRSAREKAGHSCCEVDTHEAQLAPLYQVPAFALTERSRQTITRETLAGHVWIADFIFTRCPGPCPIMTGKMASLQKHFEDLPDLRLVTITVDPKHDTAERLQDYARRYRADEERWLFLTGEPEKIYDLSINGFKLAAPKDAQGAASGDHLITHSTKFVLVDRAGYVRGYYEGTDPQSVDQLKADVRRVAAEAPASRPAAAPDTQPSAELQ